ncbi:MAG: YfcE family phosphodiesterase [Oscillospiraceae bacterium]
MRILILSDSHGDVESMKAAVARTQPQQILHLGDCWRDAEALQRAFPLLPLARVPGNCDACDLSARGPSELTLTFQGHRVFLCHGHRYHVKSGLLALSYAAREAGAELCLFGHTHLPCLERLDGLTLLNPGSIGAPHSHGFAVAEIDGGKLRCALLSL